MTTQATREETTVAIVGGGVAGLTVAMLLRRSGIDCVVLERQSRAYVEQRQRAGLVEYRGVRMFTEWGLGDLLGSFRDADLVLCADDVPRSFPWPDPVLTAMLQLGTGDVREVAVVSATEDGVLSGHRAGAGLVVGIGGGARPVEALREAGATHVLDSIAAFSDLLI